MFTELNLDIMNIARIPFIIYLITYENFFKSNF